MTGEPKIGQIATTIALKRTKLAETLVASGKLGRTAAQANIALWMRISEFATAKDKGVTLCDPDWPWAEMLAEALRVTEGRARAWGKLKLADRNTANHTLSDLFRMTRILSYCVDAIMDSGRTNSDHVANTLTAALSRGGEEREAA